MVREEEGNKCDVTAAFHRIGRDLTARTVPEPFHAYYYN